MNVNLLIESYVAEVASQLPRKLRRDVAFELQALLKEELQGRAEDAGRKADEAMAMELLKSFGRPEAVAARYQPTLVIIDPEDGRYFLRASIIGMAIIWLVGLLRVSNSDAEGLDWLSVISQWYSIAVLPSLWWPGLLVVWYGIAAWARRNRPEAADWKPGAIDRDRARPALLILGIAAITASLYLLLDPAWLLDVVFGGRAARAAYDAFTYTPEFRQTQAPVLLLLLVLNIPLFLAVAINRRWTKLTRKLENGLSLLVCGAMIWTLFSSDIMVGEESNSFVKLCFVLIIISSLLGMSIKWYRASRPTPAPDLRLNN